jgi:hypothetical protein
MIAPMLMRFHLPCPDVIRTANIKQMTFATLLIAGFYPAIGHDKLAPRYEKSFCRAGHTKVRAKRTAAPAPLSSITPVLHAHNKVWI